MSDEIWTPDTGQSLGDVASMDYGDLLDLLRKDLQLDPATDILSLTGAVAGYQSFAFANTWGSDVANFGPARYYKDPFGIVHFEGRITKNAGAGSFVANEVLFTMPPGYIPGRTGVWSAACAGGGGTPSYNHVEVHVACNLDTSPGQVTLGPYGGNANPVNYISLWTVSYKAAA